MPKNKFCEQCNLEVKFLKKNEDYLDLQKKKVTILNVPYSSCDCEDTMSMRDFAILEFYVYRDKTVREIDFGILAEKYKEKSTLELMDPEGKLPIENL